MKTSCHFTTRWETALSLSPKFGSPALTHSPKMFCFVIIFIVSVHKFMLSSRSILFSFFGTLARGTRHRKQNVRSYVYVVRAIRNVTSPLCMFIDWTVSAFPCRGVPQTFWYAQGLIFYLSICLSLAQWACTHVDLWSVLLFSRWVFFFFFFVFVCSLLRRLLDGVSAQDVTTLAVWYLRHIDFVLRRSSPSMPRESRRRRHAFSRRYLRWYEFSARVSQKDANPARCFCLLSHFSKRYVFTVSLFSRTGLFTWSRFCSFLCLEQKYLLLCQLSFTKLLLV